MNHFAHYVAYITNSVPARKPRSRIDWRALGACGFLVLTAVLHFGANV